MPKSILLKDKLSAAVSAMKRFEKASIALSWKGSGPPEDWDDIENEYNLAKQNLLKYLPNALLVAKKQPGSLVGDY